MTDIESDRVVTNVHVNNVITLLESALDDGDAVRRAQYLAGAQRQLGWAQRRALDECQRLKLPWR